MSCQAERHPESCQACRRSGCPGVDDIRFSQYVRPRLTTIRSPLDQLAQIGVELLFEQLHDSGAKARTEVLPVELVIRESAVPPAGD